MALLRDGRELPRDRRPAIATVLAGDVVRYDFTLNDTIPPLGTFLTSTNTAIVWWASHPLGWNLLQNTNLNGTNWVAPPETVNDNGITKSIIINPPLGTRFFRLRKS